jgi:beta-phosphoglucomutase
VALAREIDQPFTRADFQRTFGQRNPEILRLLFNPDYSDDEVARLGERKEVLYRAAARSGVDLLPGVRSLLEGLKSASLRQAVGSSAPRANVELIFELTRIRDFFAAVVSMEDTRKGKPDPEVFLTAARKLGIEPSRCLVIEDAVAGIQAAQAGGMKSIAVTFVGHHPAEKLQAAGADLVVGNLAEVSVEQVRQILG